MKKFFLSAAVAAMSLTAMAQTTVGISRPMVGGVYDDFAYITTANFNNSAEGLTVQFYQTPELEATLALDETAESGYAKSNLRYRGNGFDVDYVWKIQNADYDKNDVTKGLGDSNYTFGFDLTVAEGNTFTVTALDLDLLLEQNPSWRLRIVDANGTDLYNSTWVTKTGGYNSAQWGAGWYGRFTTTEVSFETADNSQALQYYPCLDDPTVAIIPADLTLAAGSYKVLCDVDYNNENLKGLSFDHLNIEGTLTGATGDGGQDDNEDSGKVGIVRPMVGGVYDDFAYISTANFNNSIEGLTVQFYQTPELEATLALDETAESGYAKSTLRYRGNGFDVDYVWKIQNADYDKNDVTKGLGDSNYTFGFDLTVAEGKAFTVTALDLDLLLEQNPSWRLRIVDANGTDLYNSTWVTKTGGYNSAQWGAGWYGRFTTTEVSFETADNSQALQYYPCLDDPTVALIPSNLILTSGSYKVLCDVDYNNENLKGLSFDHLTIEGSLDAATGISTAVVGSENNNGARYNLSGQKVDASYKGIVIQNGKKYLVK